MFGGGGVGVEVQRETPTTRALSWTANSWHPATGNAAMYFHVKGTQGLI
jgi:hypothetical protein